MIDKKIIKMSVCMMSGLLFCPLIAFAQIYTTEINVEETPFISDVIVECLDENIRLSVHLENTGLHATYTLTNTSPINIGIPETNTTGIFIIPNFQLSQSATFETNYGFCSDSRQINFNCSIILPVSIIDIFAELLNNNTADIIWKIANEQNVKHYIVEKSGNGFTFDQIGLVPVTAVLTNFKTYKFEDKSLFSGINYYRIKVVDYDGSMHYTKIVSVTSIAGQTIGFKIYPNPTFNNLFVEYTNIKATYLDLSIYNQLGQRVASTKFTDGIIPKIIELSLSELTAGTYIIKATDQNGKESISKFFKMI